MTNTACCHATLPVVRNNQLFKIDCALKPHHEGEHKTAAGIEWGAPGTVAPAQEQAMRNTIAARASSAERAKKRS